MNVFEGFLFYSFYSCSITKFQCTKFQCNKLLCILVNTYKLAHEMNKIKNHVYEKNIVASFHITSMLNLPQDRLSGYLCWLGE